MEKEKIDKLLELLDLQAEVNAFVTMVKNSTEDQQGLGCIAQTDGGITLIGQARKFSTGLLNKVIECAENFKTDIEEEIKKL